MRSIYLLILYLLFSSILYAQTAGGIEQYHYISSSDAYTIVPVVHLQSKKGWYGEARYNYDEKNTFSLLGGKTFSGQKNMNWSVTPMLGIAFGEMNGYTLGFNFSAEKGHFFLNTQSQYTITTTSKYNNYFFNWSELGYQPLTWLYGGITIQHTMVSQEKGLIEPGLLLGFTVKNVSFPFYLFNPFSTNRFFVLGLEWEWNH